jgi:NAD-dependent deacetylase
MEKQLNKALQLIKDGKNFIALTGAGISTSAGIPDFRGPKGIYTTGTDPEKVFGIDNFKRNPEPFFRFKRKFIQILEGAKPTKMHNFLYYLEKKGKEIVIITQNIDGLHTLAGSKKVIEFHGSIRHSHCLKCKKKISFEELKNKLEKQNIPECSCGGVIKPDIVFFGEPVNGLDEAFKIMLKADTMLIIGTSLSVYPASILPNYFKGNIIIINKGQLANFVLADVFLDMNIEEAADFFFDKLAK